MSEVAAEYDIFIAGGGMIGSSLAAALASLELSVAMVEAVDRGAGEQPSFDERSTALSRSFWFCVASPTPLLTQILTRRGTSMTFL